MGDAILARNASGGGGGIFPAEFGGGVAFTYFLASSVSSSTNVAKNTLKTIDAGYFKEKNPNGILYPFKGTPVICYALYRFNNISDNGLDGVLIPFEYGKDITTVYENASLGFSVTITSRIVPSPTSGAYCLEFDVIHDYPYAITIYTDPWVTWGTYIPA